MNDRVYTVHLTREELDVLQDAIPRLVHWRWVVLSKVELDKRCRVIERLARKLRFVRLTSDVGATLREHGGLLNHKLTLLTRDPRELFMGA